MIATMLDSSAWIEYLRRTGSETNRRVRSLVEEDSDIWTTDVVMLELLAGARSSRQRTLIRALLNRCTFFPIRPLFDYEAAALLYARCRAGGVPPRRMTDCLIAAAAIRADVPLLHADADFDRIAEHTTLRVA